MNRYILIAAISSSIASPVCADETFDPDAIDFRAIQQHTTEATTAQAAAKNATPGSIDQQKALASAEANKTAIVVIANKYPKSSLATQAAGRSLAQLGDYDRAKPLADRGVDLAEKKGDPKLMTQAHLLRGDVNFGMKDYEAALKDAEAVLKLDPKNKAALSLKFESAGRTTGRSAGAAATVGGGSGAGGGTVNAADGAPRGGTGGISAYSTAPVDPRRAAAVLTQTPQRQKAEGLLREAAQRMSIDPASALALADKAVAADPEDPRAYFTRAAARRASGDLAGALADLDRTLALNPTDAAAHGAKASVSAALGRSVDEIKKEFLASGRDAADFSDYYREQVAAMTGKPAAKGDAGGPGAAPGGPWAAGGGLTTRLRENAGALILLGLGLVVFGGALLFQTRKRMGDGRRDA